MMVFLHWIISMMRSPVIKNKAKAVIFRAAICRVIPLWI